MSMKTTFKCTMRYSRFWTIRNYRGDILWVHRITFTLLKNNGLSVGSENMISQMVT